MEFYFHGNQSEFDVDFQLAPYSAIFQTSGNLNVWISKLSADIDLQCVILFPFNVINEKESLVFPLRIHLLIST